MKSHGTCLGAALILLGLAFNNAAAASRWFTARTINGSTQPLSAGTESFIRPDGRQMKIVSAALTNGLVDIVISLYSDPWGDDDGNTQDVDPNSRDQDNYEKIIQYFADGVYEQTDGAHALPAGVYRFYFGLDVNPNGVLDENALYYDMAVLTVQ